MRNHHDVIIYARKIVRPVLYMEREGKVPYHCVCGYQETLHSSESALSEAISGVSEAQTSGMLDFGSNFLRRYAQDHRNL